MTQRLERSVPTKGSNSEMAAQSYPILQASQQEPMGFKSKTVYRHTGGGKRQPGHRTKGT